MDRRKQCNGKVIFTPLLVSAPSFPWFPPVEPGQKKSGV
jgi:hypothetical protein